MNDIYLLNKSPYNFYTSVITIEELVNFAKERKLESIGLVETNSLVGLYEFYNLCKKENIKPIISLEKIINNVSYIFTPINEKGFHELIKISNEENIESSLNNKNLLAHIYIDNNNSKDFFISNSTKFSGAFVSNKVDFDKLSKEGYVVYHQKMNNSILNKDEELLKLLFKLNNNEEIYFPTSSLENSPIDSNINELSDRINIQIKGKARELPLIHKYQDWDFFEALCFKGLQKRLDTSKIPVSYFDRLKKELIVIKDKNFYSYFLVFFDIVQFCKSEEILIGPGRGSAPGSLVTYSLFITDLDPLKNDLIFERFLNPLRSNLPDIDLDIEDTRRNDVVDYLFNKYGIDHVANITTYSTFGIKGAFREICKVTGINDFTIKEVTKYIPHSYIQRSLEELLDSSNHLLQKYSTNEKIKYALDMAEKISPLPRHSSIHAAGVVMLKESMKDNVPVYRSSKNYPTTQWKMEEIEKWGLSKLDLLGLRNLTIIKTNIEAIFQNKNIRIDLSKIPNNDRKTFDLLSEAKVDGIFQLESDGMRKVLKRMKPRSIEEIGLVSALFRPGAMSHIDECVSNKFNPYQIKKIHPIVDKILSNTYGVLVYQEQVIQLMVDFASMSYGDADLMRRVISKKDSSNLEEIKKTFFSSATKKHPLELVENVWNDIVKFAGYGFNRSHAIAYAQISYWMGYLKANFPVEFICSSLRSFQMDKFKVMSLIGEARNLFNITVLGPDLNRSGFNFSISNGQIIAPITMIKGIGPTTARSIIKERNENGPHLDFINTIDRLYSLKVHKESIILLIKSGAFSNIPLTTKEMILNFEDVYVYTKLNEASSTFEKPKIKKKKDSIIELANWENEALGLNISRSVFHLIECTEEGYTPRTLEQLKEYDNVPLDVLVKVINVDKKKTKKGDDMIIMAITDGYELEKVFIFGNNIEKVEKSIKKDKFYKMKLSVRENKSTGAKNFGFFDLVKEYKY